MIRVNDSRNAGMVFRIHRKKDIEEMGLPKGGRWEVHNFFTHLKKHRRKGGRTTVPSGLIALHWRKENKGYPKGFTNYYTYDEEREKRCRAS